MIFALIRTTQKTALSQSAHPVRQEMDGQRLQVAPSMGPVGCRTAMSGMSLLFIPKADIRQSNSAAALYHKQM
jgi:hypothetical protein